MSRHEVTAEEWSAFLNHPRVIGRIDENGRAEPLEPEVRELLAARGRPLRVQLVPRYNGLLGDRVDGAWKLRLPAPWPIQAVSQLAAREYAFWRTSRARERGEPWRFRLPTDEEWTRAARGADRRRFVWGDYHAWSFCWSTLGCFFSRAAPVSVGITPTDESVFGIRDLAGSAAEHTSERPVSELPNTSYRGGSWNSYDEEYFHIATRSSLPPWDRHLHFGVRLVAVIEESSEEVPRDEGR